MQNEKQPMRMFQKFEGWKQSEEGLSAEFEGVSQIFACVAFNKNNGARLWYQKRITTPVYSCGFARLREAIHEEWCAEDMDLLVQALKSYPAPG